MSDGLCCLTHYHQRVYGERALSLWQYDYGIQIQLGNFIAQIVSKPGKPRGPFGRVRRCRRAVHRGLRKLLRLASFVACAHIREKSVMKAWARLELAGRTGLSFQLRHLG